MNRKQGNSLIKCLLALCLVVSILIFQAPQVMAETLEEGSSAPVEVSTFEELQTAISEAEDGDVIGITDIIKIPANTNIGDPEKHVTIQKIDVGSYTGLEVETSDEASTIHIQNITFNGDNISNESFIISKGKCFLIM